MEMVHAIDEAEQRLEGIATTTPLQPSIRLSEQYGATILIKREDMQAVRSFKIRGAYNKIASLSPEDRKRPVVCASAGNHAQGVAFACAHLGIGATIFMPRITPTQKIERVEHFGGELVEIRLVGDSYDESSAAAEEYCAQTQRTFDLCRRYVDRVVLLPEGKVCTTMIELYQNEGIVTEPAGALALSALDDVAEEIRGKTVVCVLSGGNNDVLRYPEVLERSLVYLGRKHYFIIEFAQKPGQLRQFVDDALGPTDDIVRFEYIKKTNRERGAALVGIELKDRADLEPLLQRMEQIQLNFRPLGSEELLYQYLV